MQAPHAEQVRLLEVQGQDTAIAQLQHRITNLPEHAEVGEISTRLRTLADLVVAAKTEISDLKREVAKAETDVEQVRSRFRRDEERLNAGQGSPKELEQLQHELQSLARRQTELEEVELEILERLESAEAHHSKLLAEQSELEIRLENATARRESSTAELNSEIEKLRLSRQEAVAAITSSLYDLYEKVRHSSGGVGAALLKQRRCEGCRLELNSIDLNRIKAASEDEIIRCEECRRILVRTHESGL